jgi:hypothetical protein
MTIFTSRRTLASTIVSLALSSCGGEAKTRLVQRVGFLRWPVSIQGRFDGLTEDQAAFAGTLILIQGSPRSGDLTGSLTMTISAQGTVNSTGEAPLESAS